MRNVGETEPPYTKKKLPRRVLGKYFLRSLIPYKQRRNIHATKIMAFISDIGN